MKYKVIFDKTAERQLNKLDIFQQKIIVNWILKNLANSSDPRSSGKSLKGNLKNYWRYRVGDYRIIADINDDEVKIIIIGIGNRKDIYQRD